MFKPLADVSNVRLLSLFPVLLTRVMTTFNGDTLSPASSLAATKKTTSGVSPLGPMTATAPEPLSRWPLLAAACPHNIHTALARYPRSAPLLVLSLQNRRPFASRKYFADETFSVRLGADRFASAWCVATPRAGQVMHEMMKHGAIAVT
jgi:hypothetical protein